MSTPEQPPLATLPVEGRDPLASPAVGTATDDLVRGCSARIRRAPLPPVAVEPPLALAFSGGGFRATFTALGTLRLVADCGLLPRVRYVASVSGGSVAHGLFAHAYSDLEAAGFTTEALDRLVIGPAVERVTRRSLQLSVILNLWRTLGRKTRTGVLADLLDDWFFNGRKLSELSASCRFIFNASNLTTGVRFTLEREVIGDWVMGPVRTESVEPPLRLADAVAASAALPGAFAPVALKNVPFPCAEGRTAKLLDGGAYDNLGLEALDDLPRICVVAVNAGGTFRTGSFGRVPLIRDLKRANSLLYRQTVSLRMREMVDRFRAFERAREEGRPAPPWARQGALFSLATTIDPDRALEWREGREEHPELRIPLALTKTSLSKFSEQRCHELLYRGWWLAGAVLSQFHRRLLPETLPSWAPPKQ